MCKTFSELVIEKIKVDQLQRSWKTLVSLAWDRNPAKVVANTKNPEEVWVTLLISDLEPSFNENIGSEKLFLY